MANAVLSPEATTTYLQAHRLLTEAMALLDRLDDSLAAAQLSHVVERIEAAIVSPSR